MSGSDNESINEFAKLIHGVNDISFLKSLKDFMEGPTDAELSSDTSNDMKKHIIMFVKGRKGNRHVRGIISHRIKQLKRSSSHKGGRRKTHSRRKGVKRSTRRA
jgi:hypothetical protein